MSRYIEIPKLDPLFPYRSFICYGWEITYPHWHKEIEIIYCLKGTVNLGINEQIVKLEEGDIYLFNSGEMHFFLSSPDSERIVYQFDENFFHHVEKMQISERSLDKMFNSIASFSKDWPQTMKKNITRLLITLFQKSVETGEASKYEQISLLYQLVAAFYRLPVIEKKSVSSSQSVKNKEVMQYLNTVFAFVEDHFMGVITLDEIASHIGFSPAYFSRFFKKHVGTTFSQYLTEYRINVAKFILGTTQIPLIEVAEKSGFASVKTFHHVFKAQVGLSPKQFQKALVSNQLV